MWQHTRAEIPARQNQSASSVHCQEEPELELGPGLWSLGTHWMGALGGAGQILLTCYQLDLLISSFCNQPLMRLSTYLRIY